MPSFKKDRRGSIATMVGLSLPMVLFAGGAAVDTGYAVMLRGELMQITRLACVRLSTSAADFATAARQSDVTTTVIDSLLAESRLDEDNTAFTFAPASGGSANVNAQSIYQTKFLQIFGLDQLGLAADEVCTFELRIPTSRPDPTDSCDVTVPSRPVNASLDLTLGDARNEWRDYNETCTTDSLGQTNCARPPAPDEMIATVLTDATPARVAARVLLTTNSDRGTRRVQYDDLPRGELSLQPLNGYPAVLPQTCNPVPPAPPAPAPTPTSSSGGTPSVPTSSGGSPSPGGCTGGSGSVSINARVSVSEGGTGSIRGTANSSDGCGGTITGTSTLDIGDGGYSGESTFTNGDTTSTSTQSGTGTTAGTGGFANDSGTGSFVYGPDGGLDTSGVGAWL